MHGGANEGRLTHCMPFRIAEFTSVRKWPAWLETKASGFLLVRQRSRMFEGVAFIPTSELHIPRSSACLNLETLSE